jgi:hypothetical protein
VQIAISKASELARQGVAANTFSDYAFDLVRTLLRGSLS